MPFYNGWQHGNLTDFEIKVFGIDRMISKILGEESLRKGVG